MLEIGQVLAARYALLRRLNSGSWGEVWLARDGDRDVALKVLAPELAADAAARARFLATARLQTELRDPAILPCETVVDGDPCLAVYSYAPGGDLSAWRGRPWPALVPVLTRIARAVSALNSHGYVHRDLKPANVVLGAAGEAMLADLGVAARIGESTSLPPGSPFSASPQQLAGEPPTVADDVYGFGALAYELLSGYPPYYPDEAAARSSEMAPPPVRTRVPLPDELQQLVLACLARSPEGRPAELVAVATALERLPTPAPDRDAGAPAAVTVSVRPPQDAAAPIEPRWRPSTATDQASGDAGRWVRVVTGVALAVLVVAVAIAFVVLPRWASQRMPQPQVAAPPTAPAAPAADPEAKKRDLKRLAELKRDYETRLPPIKQRLEKLMARAAAEWGGATFERGRSSFEAASKSFADSDYEAAARLLSSADTDLKATDALGPAALRNALAAGAQALTSGTAADAQRAFELALKLQPDHAVAKRGLERAKSLDQVRSLLAEAERLEGEGRIAEATAAWRRALELDRDNGVAQQALARLASSESNAAFAAAMSQGLTALARQDLEAARAAFQRADRIRPGAAEAQDGLAQVARAQGDAGIATHLSDAQRAERDERWQAALEAYRRALVIDSNLLAAQQGVERTEPRAALEAQLNGYAGRPERLFSNEVRAAARASLERARAIQPAGPVLTQQIATVERLVNTAEQPVAVELSSDNQTIVTIYRVGRIGVFERKGMELLPGRYIIVGTRAGYRDVRHELMVLPGQAPSPVTIRCEEPI